MLEVLMLIVGVLIGAALAYFTMLRLVRNTDGRHVKVTSNATPTDDD